MNAKKFRWALTLFFLAAFSLSAPGILQALPAHELSHDVISPPTAKEDAHQRLQVLLSRMEARSQARREDARRLQVELPSNIRNRSTQPTQDSGIITLRLPDVPQESASSGRLADLSAGNKVVPPLYAPAATTLPKNPPEISEKAPFETAFRMINSMKARREAEAKRLGVILPSQGGSTSLASKAYVKLARALAGMIDRSPDRPMGNFGFFPG